MAKFNIDFTDAKEYTMCGKGEHDFKITNAELKSYTKDGENREKIELACEAFGGEDSGSKVYKSIFLKNSTGLFIFLNKIGITIEKKTYNNLDTTMFIGKTFTANVEYETYKKIDGTIGNKAVIIDATIRKYNNSSNEAPDGIGNDDMFSEFENSTIMSAEDLPF